MRADQFFTNIQPLTSNICFDHFSGDCIGRVTPVPIPNTAVKPTGADDTASFRCGKVGSRRIYFKKSPLNLSGFFCVWSIQIPAADPLLRQIIPLFWSLIRGTRPMLEKRRTIWSTTEWSVFRRCRGCRKLGKKEKGKVDSRRDYFKKSPLNVERAFYV